MRAFGVLGAVFGGVAVAAGAFGAHGLKHVLAPDMLVVFETAARYQMYHALALLAIGMQPVSKSLRAAGWAFVAGVLLFSGSLFLLSASGVRWLGAVTPVGGVCFLVGWALLGRHAWTSRSAPRS